MRRWRAPKGTAALLRERVSGCRRSPRPPAITIPRTRGMCGPIMGDCGRASRAVRRGPSAAVQSPRTMGSGRIRSTASSMLTIAPRSRAGSISRPALHEPAMQDARLSMTETEDDDGWGVVTREREQVAVVQVVREDDLAVRARLLHDRLVLSAPEADVR